MSDILNNNDNGHLCIHIKELQYYLPIIEHISCIVMNDLFINNLSHRKLSAIFAGPFSVDLFEILKNI